MNDMTKPRMSSLPVLQYCGLSGRLNSASIRAGVISSYHHARCSGDTKETARLWLQLTPEERADVETWHRPSHVMVGDLIYNYESAEKELEVALDKDGCHVAFDSPDAIMTGHLDMAWTQGTEAVVVDIKRQTWTAHEGPQSLQIAAYGRAYASMRGASAYTPGVFVAMTGDWLIGSRVELESAEGEEIWQRILGAARNQELGEASVGAHCNKCFSRLKCPEFLLPAIQYGKFGASDLTTAEQVAEALVAAKGLKELSERIFDTAKVLHERGMRIVDKSGFEYKPSPRKGREYINVKQARASMGAAIEPLIQRARDGVEWDWVKPKRTKQ